MGYWDARALYKRGAPPIAYKLDYAATDAWAQHVANHKELWVRDSHPTSRRKNNLEDDLNFIDCLVQHQEEFERWYVLWRMGVE